MAIDLSGWTVVFDLDGTLIDTAPDLIAAMNFSLTKGGFKAVSPEIGRGYIGAGAKAMLRAGLAAQNESFEEDAIDALWHVFLGYYVDHISDNSKPFKGCVDTLEQLSKAGAQLAVCTNKTQALADQLLEEIGLTHYFVAVVGADSVAHKKPSGDHIHQTVSKAGGDVDKAIMVGDSTTDERAAIDLTLPFIFVRFGYGPGPDREPPSTRLARNYTEVTQLVISIAAEQDA